MNKGPVFAPDICRFFHRTFSLLIEYLVPCKWGPSVEIQQIGYGKLMDPIYKLIRDQLDGEIFCKKK
jgi:hypothetical protein